MSKDLLFDEFCLEALDILNEGHIDVMEKFRDKVAVDMCYDVMVDVERTKEQLCQCEDYYLIKNSNGYFGYLCISDRFSGEKELSYIIQENLRQKGLGTVVLNTISKYLLEEDVDTSSVILDIKTNNVSGIKLAVKCGFIEVESQDRDYVTYEKRFNK